MKPIHCVLLIIALSTGFSSCKKAEPLAERILKTDRITFVGAMPGKTGDAVDLSDSTLLKLFKALPSWKKLDPAQSCRFDGMLYFFSGADTVLDPSISMDASCISALYMDGDSALSVQLPADALAILSGAYRKSLKISELDRFKWMLGKWTQSEPNGAVSIESWHVESETNLRGFAFTTVGKDTVFQEKLNLVQEGQGFYYEVRLKDNTDLVRFRLAESTEKSATFENKAHDYPQIIYYEAIGDSGLYARISGTVNGQYQKAEFPLKRVVEGAQ